MSQASRYRETPFPERPRSNPLVPRLLVGALALVAAPFCGVGCVSDGAPKADPEAVRRELERWSQPLYFGHWGLQFEQPSRVDWSHRDQTIVFERTTTIRRTNRELQVRGRWYQPRPGSLVRMYRPAFSSSPLEADAGPVTLFWHDAQGQILLEERRPPTERVDGAFVTWHVIGCKLEVYHDHSVIHVDETGERTPIPGAKEIHLDANGALRGGGS